MESVGRPFQQQFRRQKNQGGSIFESRSRHAAASRAVRAAIPGATDEDVEFVIWSRTPWPMTAISAREVYRAASGLHRARLQGRRLCDWCERIALPDRWACVTCEGGLLRLRDDLRAASVERDEPVEVTA